MPKYSREQLFSLLRPLPKEIKRDIYDIPIVPKVKLDLARLNDGIFLQAVNNCTGQDSHRREKIVHCFVNDRYLFPLYDHALRDIPKLARYYAVMTPDYSMFPEMDFYQILSATYRNRYLGALWSIFAIRPIVSVGWTLSKYYDICFAGISQGSTVAITSNGTHHRPRTREMFLSGYRELLRRCRPETVICLGKPLPEMDKQRFVCVPYGDSFGNQFRKGWQTRLFPLVAKKQP